VFAIATGTEAVGSIGLMLGQDVHRYTAELGYWLAEPYWGRGIVTLAVLAMVEYAFGELGLHRVHAEPYAPNLASARVLEKAGFRLEGRMRASAFKDGRIVDQLLYAIVKV
jgi:ribosomal-protein-alanine N-acetyltransferase